MSTKTKAVLAAAAVLGTVLAASARDKGPPRIDVAKTCRANTNALNTPMGGEIQGTFDSCVEDEKMALEQITSGWAEYPAAAKSQCVQTDAYLPNYVEWLVCLELTQDVMKKRAEAPTGDTGDSSSSLKGKTSHRGKAARKECPVVKTTADGSIAWVDACPLGPPF